MPAIIPIISGIAGIAGGLGQGRAQGRAAEAQIGQQGDQNALRAYETQQRSLLDKAQLELAQRQFGQQAAGQNQRRYLASSLLSNAGPMSRTTVPGVAPAEISGGPRIDDATRAGMGDVSQQLLVKLLQGEKFDPVQMLTPPTATPLPKPGMLDKILGIVGPAAGFASALGPAFGPRTPAPSTGIAPRMPSPVSFGGR